MFFSGSMAGETILCRFFWIPDGYVLITIFGTPFAISVDKFPKNNRKD